MFVNRDLSISDSFSCRQAKLSGRLVGIAQSGIEFAYYVFSSSCWLLKCEKGEDPTV